MLGGNLPDAAYEREFIRKDGIPVAVLLEHRVIRNSESRIVGLLTTVQDLSSRKKTEEELARGRDLLHTLMDAIPDCIYFKDKRGCFTTINKAQADLMGVADTGMAIGKNDGDFFDGTYARHPGPARGGGDGR
jgi:PAS domain-containing protein